MWNTGNDSPPASASKRSTQPRRRRQRQRYLFTTSAIQTRQLTPKVPIGHPHEIFMFAANPRGRLAGATRTPSALPILRRLETMRSGALREYALAGGELSSSKWFEIT